MTEVAPSAERQDRCPGVSYTEMLQADTRRVPDFLFAESTQPLSDEPLDPARYTSEAFAAAEREKLWPEHLGIAAREEDLPEPGDTVVYEIADKNYLLVRQPDRSIKAFQTSACTAAGCYAPKSGTPSTGGARSTASPGTMTAR